MKVSNALYTYPVLSESSLRDDYVPESSFSAVATQHQTGVNEMSIEVSVDLKDDTLLRLVQDKKAKIVCHVESPLSSYRSMQEIDMFTRNISLPIDTTVMRGSLEITPFVTAAVPLEEFTSDTFSEFYKGTYRIEAGDILAFAPTIEIEIEPDDIDKLPTQSIIRVSSHDAREMATDLAGNYILIRLPEDTYKGYKVLSKKESSHYKLSIMGIVLPALMDALYELKTNDGQSDDKIWARVVKAKLKDGGRGSDVAQYDPLVHAQFLLNNPADGAFVPIIDSMGADD